MSQQLAQATHLGIVIARSWSGGSCFGLVSGCSPSWKGRGPTAAAIYLAAASRRKQDCAGREATAGPADMRAEL